MMCTGNVAHVDASLHVYFAVGKADDAAGIVVAAAAAGCHTRMDAAADHGCAAVAVPDDAAEYMEEMKRRQLPGSAADEV